MVLALVVCSWVALAVPGERVGAAQDAAASDKGLEERADYLGFEFKSLDARKAVIDYLIAVGSARFDYEEAEDELDIGSRVGANDVQFRTEEQSARSTLARGLEGLVDRALKGGKAREALSLAELKARVMNGEVVPERRFLVTKSPKGPIDHFKGHYYRLFSKDNEEEKLTNHMAAQRCKELGGYLVCLETLEELRFLEALAQAQNRGRWFWHVGATDENEEGVWTWANGTPVKSEMWHENQPDSNPGHGAANYSSLGAWKNDGPLLLDDVPDGVRMGFICEWGGGPVLGWDGDDPKVMSLVKGYWKILTEAQEAHDKELTDCNKKLVRHRLTYDREVGKASKALTKELKVLMKSVARTGDLQEVQKLADAIERLQGSESFKLRPLGTLKIADGTTAFSGSHFRVMEERVPWHVARKLCREKGGRLAIADTPAKFQFMSSLLPRQGTQYWLGATDEAKEGDWIWENGERLDKGIVLGNYGRVAHALVVLSGTQERDAKYQSDVADERKPYICEWPWYW